MTDSGTTKLSQATVERVSEDRRAWDAFAAAALSVLAGGQSNDHAVERSATLADLMMEQRRLRHAKPPQMPQG